MPTQEDAKLDDNPGTMRFTNVQDLFEAIDHTTDNRDSLTIYNVPVHHFTESILPERIRDAASVFGPTTPVPRSLLLQFRPGYMSGYTKIYITKLLGRFETWA